MIMASAVISTGRIRVAPASSAAASGVAPSSWRCRANDTSRILLAVATPMVMIAPVSAGTLKVVPVMNSIHAMPASAAGNAATMIAGVDPRLEIDDHQQIDEHDRHHQADAESDERRLHRLHLAAHDDLAAARQARAHLVDLFLDLGRDAGQVGALHADEDVDRRHDVVARCDRELPVRFALRPGCPAAARCRWRPCRGLRAGRRDRHVEQRIERIDAVLRRLHRDVVDDPVLAD